MDEVYQKQGLYADDPYGAPTVTVEGLQESKVVSCNMIRRRSSQVIPVTPPENLNPDPHGKVHKKQLPSLSALKSFQWPSISLSRDFVEKNSPELAKASPELVERLSDPMLWTRRRRLSPLAMLREDVFGSDWYMMAVPAVLFAVQNNLM